MSTIYYNDILAESLAFGTRREIAMLEATNRRIHGIIDCWLSDAPFLVFDLKYTCRGRTSAFRRILVDTFTEFVPKDNFPCEQELYVSVFTIRSSLRSLKEIGYKYAKKIRKNVFLRKKRMVDSKNVKLIFF